MLEDGERAAVASIKKTEPKHHDGNGRGNGNGSGKNTPVHELAGAA